MPMSGTWEVSRALRDIERPRVLARATLTSRCSCTDPLLLTLTLFSVPAWWRTPLVHVACMHAPPTRISTKYWAAANIGPGPTTPTNTPS